MASSDDRRAPSGWWAAAEAPRSRANGCSCEALQPPDREDLRRVDPAVHPLSREEAPVDDGRDRDVAFLSWLAVDKQVSASTQNQALSAVLFLYRQVLVIDIEAITHVPRARMPDKLP